MNNNFTELKINELAEIEGGGWLSVVGGALIIGGSIATGGGLGAVIGVFSGIGVWVTGA